MFKHLSPPNKGEMHVCLWLFVNINAVIYGFKKSFVAGTVIVNPANRLIYREMEHVIVLQV